MIINSKRNSKLTVRSFELLYFSVTVSENVPVRRSRRLAHMDTNGNKLSSPEASDNEMDTTQVNRYY